MATLSIDLGKVLNAAGQLQLAALKAGADYLQFCAQQTGAFSQLASTTLSSLQGNGTISQAVKQLTVFGKNNTDSFATASKRIGTTYFDDLGRVVDALQAGKGSTPAPAGRARAAGRKVKRAAARR